MSSEGRGIGSAKPRGGQKDSVKFDEVMQMFEFTKHPNEHVRVRLLEKGLIAVKRHWCKIVAGKSKKEVSIPRFCVDFNPLNENEPHDNGCPYCKHVGKDRDTSPVTNEFFYLTNAIIREIQEEEPSKKADHTKGEKKTGFKDIRTKSWTPVRVLRLTSSMVGRMQELGEQNTKTDKDTGKKKAYDVSHPKFGIDLNIKYKPKASGSDKYSIDAVGKKTPLTDEEKKYLVWNLTEELLDLCGRMSPEQAKEDFKRMELVGGEEIEDSDDDDDDDDIPVGKKSKKKKGKNAFDDEDDSPKKKKKKSKSDDDEDDEYEDDEDEAPKSKKSKKSDKGSKKKKSDKKSKKSKSDDEDDEDDEDEAPKKKKSKDKSSKGKSDKKSKKKSDDDDDEDDDEAPKKKKKSDKGSKKSDKKSKKSKFDDDDGEW